MKEKWELAKETDIATGDSHFTVYGPSVDGKQYALARCRDTWPNAKCNAREIVALHNAAIEIGEPMKVAEHIGAVVEALRNLVAGLDDVHLRMYGMQEVQQALSQLEEK